MMKLALITVPVVASYSPTCRHRRVQTNGKEITSVLYYPPAYGESDEELDPETMAESQ